MKVSLDWIKDYVALPQDLDLKKLAYDLTMSTVEVEDVEDLAERFNRIVVGQIAAIEAHPNAEKLRICKTDIGGEIKDIVCGGINLREGMKVAVSLPGAMVRWHGEGEPVEIKETKLRGVPSFGMICASSEIGLGDLFPAKEEAEIVDLSFLDCPAGTPIADALDLHDILLEIDNKSMTNRPDLWGHYGMAREIAALYDLPFTEMEDMELDSSLKTLPLEVADTDGCPRFTLTEIEGLYVKEADYKIRCRLWKVGMRPINALVDITHYVMAATGPSSHAYDANNLKGHITARRADKGEQLSLLNGKTLTLAPDDLVIADEEEAVGLAGIMGGEKDSILPTTEKVLLEIANFEATGIRRTALRYDNRTEASSRYEKAIDPERCELARTLSLKLFKEHYPDMKVTAWNDIYGKKLKCTEIDVSLTWLASRLGIRVENAVIADKLGRMGFKVEFDGDNMHVTSPSWRSTGDIKMKDDIMEEVARMYGYENFEATPITTSFTSAINQLDVDIDRKIREYLALRCGMQEIFTYPWMEDRFVDAVIGNHDNMFCLSDPPSPTEKYIRSSLLPNLCKAVEKNQHYYDRFDIFEGAQIVQDRDYTNKYFPNEMLPYQRRNIAGAFVDANANLNALFKRAKGVLESMPRYTHMEAYTFERLEKPSWADGAVWMNLVLDGKTVGNMGLLSAKTTMDCGIKDKAVILFEMDIDEMRPLPSRSNTFHHLAEFPINDFDLSMIFDTNVTWAQIKEAVDKCAKQYEILRGADFVDEYRGKGILSGKKSVTIRLSIGSMTRTLKTEEITECANAVIKRLTKTLGGVLRG